MDDLADDGSPAGSRADGTGGLARRVDELEALLATQQVVIDRLQQQLEELGPPTRHGDDAVQQLLVPPRPEAPGVDLEAPTSRRSLMTRGAAAAAGAALVGTALSVANASPAAAASGSFDGDPGVSAIANPPTGYAVQAQAASGIAVFASSATGSALYGQVTSANSTSPAVLGSAAGTGGTGVKGTVSASSGATIGVHGVAGSADGFGVAAVNVASATGSVGLTAHGSIAVRADGTRSNLYLPPSAKPPFPENPQSDPIRFQGELLFDTNKDLWMCVAPGNPGTWRRLAGRGTAGSLSLLDPTTRVYDSRPGTQPPAGTKGIFANHEQRTIDCAAAGVPKDAAAVLINATATNTNPGGFFAFFQDGKTWPNNSSLSWGLPKSTIANLAIVAVNFQRFTARMEGAGGADLIIDCIGYYQ